MTAFSKLSGHLLDMGPNSEQSEKTFPESIETSTVEFNLMYSVKYTVYIRDVPDPFCFLSPLFGALGEDAPEIAAEAGCFAGMLAKAGKIRENPPRQRTETGGESEHNRRRFLENRANSRELGKVLWEIDENPHDNAVLERKRISRDGEKCFSGAAAAEDSPGTAKKVPKSGGATATMPPKLRGGGDIPRCREKRCGKSADIPKNSGGTGKHSRRNRKRVPATSESPFETPAALRKLSETAFRSPGEGGGNPCERNDDFQRSLRKENIAARCRSSDVPLAGNPLEKRNFF